MNLNYMIQTNQFLNGYEKIIIVIDLLLNKIYFDTLTFEKKVLDNDTNKSTEKINYTNC